MRVFWKPSFLKQHKTGLEQYPIATTSTAKTSTQQPFTKLYELGLKTGLNGLKVSCNILSELLSGIHGVCQGSPLSPILFILYVCDIPLLNHNFVSFTICR